MAKESRRLAVSADSDGIEDDHESDSDEDEEEEDSGAELEDLDNGLSAELPPRSTPLQEVIAKVEAVTPAPLSVKAEPSAARAGQKRKSMADAIHETATADRNARIKMMEVKEKEKTARAETKETIKSRTLMTLEGQRMQHQREQAALDRAHALAVLDKQIELERLRAGVAPSSMIAPVAGPTQPALPWSLDPNL